jgi:hypothetical protein
MLKQYSREGMRVERQRKREEIVWDQISCTGIMNVITVMNGHECGSVATSKRPSLNGVLDSETVYMEHPPGFEASGKED